MNFKPNLSAKEGLDRLAKRLNHCRAWHGPDLVCKGNADPRPVVG